MADADSLPLHCPRCARSYPLDERFCADCGMPLVYAPKLAVDKPITGVHERARKVKPQYSEGDLVRVAGARNQTEAEFVQNLLLEEGVPSLLRRTAGFDVPDYLAAGPRDVMVPASGAEAAREILLEAEIVSDDPGSGPVAPWKVLLALLVGLALIAALVLLAGYASCRLARPTPPAAPPTSRSRAAAWRRSAPSRRAPRGSR